MLCLQNIIIFAFPFLPFLSFLIKLIKIKSTFLKSFVLKTHIFFNNTEPQILILLSLLSQQQSFLEKHV